MTRPCTQLGFALLLATIQSVSGAVLAQAASPSIGECAAIDADAERLACYDRVSGRTAAPVAPDQPPISVPVGKRPAPGSLIDTAWGFEPESDRYALNLYNPNYFLLARYTNKVNTAPFSPVFQAAGQEPDLNHTEAKFQISFKLRLWTTQDRRWGVWAAYTQQNQWQIYNGDISRPFREINFMPEAFVSFRPGLEFAGFHWNLLNIGYNHQSNGRSDPLSRNWDRAVAVFGVERDNFALLAKAWYPFNKEDNPDITDFYGYGSLTGIYKYRDHSFSVMARGNPGKAKGAVELTWMSPRFFGPLRAYVQGFFGYGESLIDYNWKQNTIGVGIALNDTL
jgi:phospholipase A1/A2